MSSTTGLRAGDTLNEIRRLRGLVRSSRNRLRAMRASRDRWRTRAQAAEWALRSRSKRPATKEA